MNGKEVRVMKVKYVAYFKILAQHSPGKTKENHKNCQKKTKTKIKTAALQRHLIFKDTNLFRAGDTTLQTNTLNRCTAFCNFYVLFVKVHIEINNNVTFKLNSFTNV
jgi:tRNA uridine 5-carbamoylmethylation protein Kti12